MKTIWKFPLIITDEQIIEVPVGAEFLSLQVQGRGIPTIWMLCNPKEERRERILVSLFGTGHDVPDHITHTYYRGTVQLAGGSLVFHAFMTQVSN